MLTLEEVLVKHNVLKNLSLKENFNLKLTRDCYTGTVQHIANAMKEYAAQFIDEAADTASPFYTDGGEEVNRKRILEIKEKIK